MVCKRQPENGKVLSGCLTAAAVWVRRHQRGKFAAGFGAVFTSESGADAHDIVARGQAVFAASEPFADDALHVVAFYGALGSFFTDYQSQPCVPRHIGIGLQHLDEAAGTLLPKCENGRKLFRCEQSVCLAEAVVQFYTARRLRPLARRAANTARPPRVLERTKKPCVRLRLVTEGW